MSEYKDNRNLKVVISPIVASKLCNMGFHIVKIKPKKVTYVGEDSGTVFLFEETPEFLNAFYEIVDKTKANLMEDL